MLPIQLGLKIMEVMTYVLDTKLSYDILRISCIHPMRCIPSTLHRLIKFNHNERGYVVEAVDENPNMIVQVGNTIFQYQNIETHEDNDEDSEEDEGDNEYTMQLYKEIGVGTYVVK